MSTQNKGGRRLFDFNQISNAFLKYLFKDGYLLYANSYDEAVEKHDKELKLFLKFLQEEDYT